MASSKPQELGTFEWMHFCVRMVLLEVIQIIIFTFPFDMANMSFSSYMLIASS
jgi:hypothetical protein